MLFDFLKKKNMTIKQVCLYDNQLTGECMKSFGEYIHNNQYIECVDIGNCITDKGIEILASYLVGNTTFKCLDISFNSRITHRSIPVLISMIKSSRIKSVDIEDTSISQQNVLVVPLAHNKLKYRIDYLELGSKDIHDYNLVSICECMKKYGVDKLKGISLSNNKITSDDASVLFETLKECRVIVSDLYLFHNQIDDECMKQLGEHLQDNEYLETLDLGNSKVTDKGIKIISEYLIGNTEMKELSWNSSKDITDASFPYLIEIAKKSNINKLDLYGTSISDEKKKEIEKYLNIPTDQREIPIKSNAKSAAKSSAFSVIKITTSAST